MNFSSFDSSCEFDDLSCLQFLYVLYMLYVCDFAVVCSICVACVNVLLCVLCVYWCFVSEYPFHLRCFSLEDVRVLCFDLCICGISSEYNDDGLIL